MPGMQRYGEISSASNCTDYQARRLGCGDLGQITGLGVGSLFGSCMLYLVPFNKHVDLRPWRMPEMRRTKSAES